MTDLDKKVLSFQNRGALVPPRHLVLNDEQIAGIRRSGEVNTGGRDRQIGLRLHDRARGYSGAAQL